MKLITRLTKLSFCSLKNWTSMLIFCKSKLVDALPNLNIILQRYKAFLYLHDENITRGIISYLSYLYK